MPDCRRKAAGIKIRRERVYYFRRVQLLQCASEVGIVRASGRGIESSIQASPSRWVGRVANHTTVSRVLRSSTSDKIRMLLTVLWLWSTVTMDC